MIQSRHVPLVDGSRQLHSVGDLARFPALQTIEAAGCPALKLPSRLVSRATKPA